MKRYHIIDADNEQYLVEEDVVKDDEVIEEATETAPALTDDEIKALKGLVARIPEIVDLLDGDKAEEDPIEDEDDELEPEERVIDTEEEEDEEEKVHDSKKSFGAIERRKSTVDDSLVDDIADAWTKRFGGNK